MTDSDLVPVHFRGIEYPLALPDSATDYIQRRIKDQARPYEEHMLNHMASRLGPQDVVIDVGANVGNHTIGLAVASGCTVVAFEPNAELADAVRRSSSANGLDDRVRVFTYAVSETKGHGRFVHLDPNNLGAQRIAVSRDPDDPFEVVRLDDLDWPTPVRIIKVDVEGMELEVLNGALELIRRDHPLLYVECAQEREFAELSKTLGDLGYFPWKTFNATPTHLFGHRDEEEAAAVAVSNSVEMTRLYVRLFERCRDRGFPPGDPWSKIE